MGSKENVILWLVMLAAIAAIIFGVVVEIARGIAWIKWAFA